MEQTLILEDYGRVVFFTGAGMSAESGVPTYRGHGGVWAQYNYEDYACQRAFEANPESVLDFHEMRRKKVLECQPHAGHALISLLQRGHRHLAVVTQNIDGLLQRANVHVAAELHGSLWRTRCETHGQFNDRQIPSYANRTCPECGQWLRPDITWFGDGVDSKVFEHVEGLISTADLFVAIGTSGVVWPAAGLAQLARESGARMAEINLEDNQASPLYEIRIRAPASKGIARLFGLNGERIRPET